jgi:hypothetical protein
MMVFAAIASKRGALADMDNAAIDVAKALARLSELAIFELRGAAESPLQIEDRGADAGCSRRISGRKRHRNLGIGF